MSTTGSVEEADIVNPGIPFGGELVVDPGMETESDRITARGQGERRREGKQVGERDDDSLPSRIASLDDSSHRGIEQEVIQADTNRLEVEGDEFGFSHSATLRDIQRQSAPTPVSPHLPARNDTEAGLENDGAGPMEGAGTFVGLGLSSEVSFAQEGQRTRAVVEDDVPGSGVRDGRAARREEDGRERTIVENGPTTPPSNRRIASYDGVGGRTSHQQPQIAANPPSPKLVVRLLPLSLARCSL